MTSVAEEEEVDRITRLPDAIIHHIFSFLPFKDVVKTSLLSKQWRLAWTSTPHINLSLPSGGVVPSISRALSLCTATKIEKFHLDATASDVRIPAELDRWFRFAAARRVEDASLVFGLLYHFVPRILCDCASLVSLRVSNCKFSWDIPIRWPSLKKLWVHDVCLDNHRIAKILSGGPVLESLTLSFLHSVCGVRIDSRSLRELVIKAACISSLDISAPNLLSLRLWGGFLRVGIRLNGVSSLAEVELNFDKRTTFVDLFSGLKFLLEQRQLDHFSDQLTFHLERLHPVYFSDQLKFLLEQLQHVTKITVGRWCLEILSAAEVSGTPYPSSRWRNIKVCTTFCKSDLLGMVYLLQSSPLLERLVICHPESDNITFENKDFSELCDFDERQFWHLQKEFCCVSNHLKRVEIVGFKFDNEKSKLLLALAKFLLEEAVGLEKMLIVLELRMSRGGVPIDPHDLGDFHDVIQLQEGCRRASRNAEGIVNYRFNGLPHEL